MKKFIMSLFFLLILPASFACDELSYTLTSLEKNSLGCHESLNFYLVKDNCTSDCFSEFNNMKFSTEYGVFRDYYFTDSTSISNPFYAMIKTVNCSDGIPQTVYIDLSGERNCSLSFSLEDEYESIQAKNNALSPTPDEIINDISPPEIDDSGSGNDNTPKVSTFEVQQTDLRTSEINSNLDIVYGSQENKLEFQKPAEITRNYAPFILFILAITAIILSIGIMSLLMRKKPKRKTRRKQK